MPIYGLTVAAMMTTSPNLYDFVMARLREKRIPQRRIAAESGVPFSTLTKIAQGQIKAPSVHHVQALHDFFVKIGADKTASTEREAA